MALSSEAKGAIAKVHEHFYTDPPMAVQPWIEVDAGTAHDSIGLLFGLLWRSIDPLVIRSTPAHSALLALAEQPPWNELVRIERGEQSLSLNFAVGGEDEQELVAILSRYNTAIEKASPIP